MSGHPGPLPVSDHVRRRFERQRIEGTAPEMALRRALHAKGLRYRVGLRPLTGLRRTVDIAFPRLRVAVFMDGCFWHGCRICGLEPKANSEWWAAKLARNVERDRDTDRCLKKAGWTVIRIWEHENHQDAAIQVVEVLRQLHSARSLRGRL